MGQFHHITGQQPDSTTNLEMGECAAHDFRRETQIIGNIRPVHRQGYRLRRTAALLRAIGYEQ